MKATWKNTVIAESDSTIEIEGNQYFPPDSVHMEFLKKNGEHSECPWKGTSDYYDVIVDGETNQGAAWSYPHPKDAAKEITGYFAFWNGVLVE